MLNILRSIRYHRRGLLETKRQNYVDAIPYFDEVIRMQPRNWAAYANRGYAYQALNEHRSALGDFNRAIDLKPNLALVYFNRGISNKFLENFEDSIADQTRAIALKPREADYYGECGVSLAIIAKHRLALECLSTAIKLNPKSAMYRRARGHVQFDVGNFVEAAADMRESLMLEDDPYAMLYGFLARSKFGDKAIATQLYSDSKRLKNSAWPSPAVDLFLNSRPPAEVLKLAESRDEKAEAQFYVGQWYLIQNDTASAILWLKEVVKDCPAYLYEYGSAIAELKRLGSH